MPKPANMTPADMLALVGRALYGPHWRLQLARGLEVDDDTIRRWMSGRTRLGADHGAMDDALELLERRELEINQAAARLRRWLTTVRYVPKASKRGAGEV